jgi:hypothetical protein
MSTTENTALAVATERRVQDTRLRAIGAIRQLDTAGETITFASVSQRSGVSRSWLYRQPDLRAEIDRLRAAPAPTVPSAQRTSTDSQHRRLEATLDEIQRLKAENQQLRELLAERLGQRRVDGPS